MGTSVLFFNLLGHIKASLCCLSQVCKGAYVLSPTEDTMLLSLLHH